MLPDMERLGLTPLVTSVLGLSLLTLTVTYLSSARRKRNIPPGPRGLPFVGYLPFITDKPYVHFHKLRQKFGGLISVYLGNRYTVVLNDYPSIKEALLQEACLGRPHGTAFELSDEAISMNDLNGAPWRDNRRLSVRLLRDLGYDREYIENHVKNEVKEFLEVLRENEGETYNIHKRLTSSVSNNITALVFGERLPYADSRRQLLDEYILIISSFFNQTSLHACYPWMKSILASLRILKYDEAKTKLDRFLGHVDKEIDSHKSTMKNDVTRDYIDGYLQNMEKPDSSQHLKRIYMKGNIRSMFGAGTEPVRTTIEWCLMTVANFPTYQQRMQEELDRVIGRERPPVMADRLRTPLTEAFIHETIRWLGIVPFTHVRVALQDTTVQGKFIPKDTVLLFNLWSIYHDEALWDDPYTFKPERFITKENAISKPEYFIPFGMGKRSCPGEPMVMFELYIYLATILQSFQIQPPEGKSVSFEGRLGIAIQPLYPELKFLTRS